MSPTGTITGSAGSIQAGPSRPSLATASEAHSPGPTVSCRLPASPPRAGGGGAALNQPRGLALDANGDLYITVARDSVSGSGRIWRLNASTDKALVWIAGSFDSSSPEIARYVEAECGGTGDSVRFDPHWIAVDPLDGTIHFYTGSQRARYCVASGTGGASGTTMASPGITNFAVGEAVQRTPPEEGSMRIGADGTRYFVLDGAIRKLPAGTDSLAVAIGLDRGYRSIGYARGAAVDAQGDVYLADSYNRQVLKFDQDGWASVLAGSGHDRSEPPAGRSGFDDFPNGGLAAAAPLGGPVDVAADERGNVYFLDQDLASSGRAFVRMVDSNGVVSTVYGQDRYLADAVSIAVNSQAEVLLAGSDSPDSPTEIWKIDTATQPATLERVAGNGERYRIGPRQPSHYPSDGTVATDTSFFRTALKDIAIGQDDTVYFTYAHRIT